jgi:hypothetical protein
MALICKTHRKCYFGRMIEEWKPDQTTLRSRRKPELALNRARWKAARGDAKIEVLMGITRT